ncbi:MAG TPA: hypothetical protein VKE94_08195 [Gemmataceae bacterium]|nr:hypothetical protein [Gemmataceae bacterium]
MSFLRSEVGIFALSLLALTTSFARADSLFVSSTATNRSLRYDSATGAPVDTGIFVPGNLEVLKYNGKTGALVGSSLFVNVGSAALKLPLGIAFGPNVQYLSAIRPPHRRVLVDC